MNLDIVKKINSEVNKNPYLSDTEQYQLADLWTPIDSRGGDCEDYAIAKLLKLHAAGMPIESLRLACCYVETGEYHAVLVVAFEDKEYVLDNRYPDPQTLNDLQAIGYKPDVIQRLGGSKEWVEWKWI